MFFLCLISSCQISRHKEPCVFPKSAGAVMLRYKRLETLQKKHNESPHAVLSCEVIVFSTSALFRFPVMYLQKRNDSRLNGLSVSFYCLVLILCSDKHPKVRFVFNLLILQTKNVGACICLFVI